MLKRVEKVGSRLGMIKPKALQAPFYAFCMLAYPLWMLLTPVR